MTGRFSYWLEMRRMKRHHRGYYPSLKKLLSWHDASMYRNGVMEITDAATMARYAELIDVGYIDNSAMVVVSRFGEMQRVLYNGNYPLTQAGERFMVIEEKARKRKAIFRTAAAFLIAAAVAAVLLVSA